jgi:hypothetical protein
MSIVSVSILDKTIVIDGEGLTFDFPYFPAKLRAIQWNGTSGTKEFATGANTFFDNAGEIEPYIDAYNEEKARLEALETETEQQV